MSVGHKDNLKWKSRSSHSDCSVLLAPNQGPCQGPQTAARLNTVSNPACGVESLFVAETSPCQLDDRLRPRIARKSFKQRRSASRRAPPQSPSRRTERATPYGNKPNASPRHARLASSSLSAPSCLCSMSLRTSGSTRRTSRRDDFGNAAHASSISPDRCSPSTASNTQA